MESGHRSDCTCNEAIRKLQNSEILTEEEKAQDVADLRGVRAFWIYVMMDYWGNIPLLTEFHPTDKVFPGILPSGSI